jgi:plasmid stabilization system protein ParE
MKHQVFMTSKATRQLAEAARWWSENRSVDQATRWLIGFEESIAGLDNRPERFPLARENGLYDLPYPVRQLVYGLGRKSTHRAVFEIRGDTVFILAIRHLAQDDLTVEEM